MKPEYYIGIDMIDEEHKQLFKYADDAYELLHDENTPDKYDRIDMILEDLRDYTAKHFNDEEQYMESINYKKLFKILLVILFYNEGIFCYSGVFSYGKKDICNLNQI